MLSYTINVGAQIPEDAVLTPARMNALFRSITISVSGTIGTSDITAGAINTTLVLPGPYFYEDSAVISANVYPVTLSPAPTGYEDGLLIAFKTSGANTGAVDVNVNGYGAKNLLKADGTEYASGEIPSGSTIEARYNGTEFRTTSAHLPTNAAFTGTLSVAGTSTFTGAATFAAAVTQRAAASNYAAGTLAAGVYAVTLAPALTAYATGQIVRFLASAINTGAVNVNVNALGEKDLQAPDGTGSGTLRELAAGEIRAGQMVEALYDGTRFVVTSALARPRFVSTDQALPSAGAVLDVAHGLGAKPFHIRWELVCQTSDQGWTAGDAMDAMAAVDADNNCPFTPHVDVGDTTNVSILRSAQALYVMTKGTGAYNTITAGNWRLRAICEL